MSRLEDELGTQLALAGFNAFKREFCAIPGRRFRWDFAWPDDKLLLEVQGGTFSRGKSGHSSGMGINRDCEKANLATLAGWRILTVDAKHVTSGQALRWIQEFFRRCA